MSQDDYARARVRAQRVAGLSRFISQDLLALWDAVGPEEFSAGARVAGSKSVGALAMAQRMAAEEAMEEIATNAVVKGWRGAKALLPVPGAYAGQSAAGYPLGNLLQAPGRTVEARLAAGMSGTEALAAGRFQLARLAENETQQAFTNANAAGMYGIPEIEGYARALVGESCPRCVILAGRIYSFEEPFKRHPLCNCTHVPVEDRDAARKELPEVFDPQGHFDAMTPEQQDEWLGKANAQAVRDGADLGQVVNLSNRRPGTSSRLRGPQGLYTTQLPDGRTVRASMEGVTVRQGRAGRRLAIETGQFADGHAPKVFERAATPRLTPQAIYDVARTPDEARELLWLHGFLDSKPIKRSIAGLEADLKKAGIVIRDDISEMVAKAGSKVDEVAEAVDLVEDAGDLADDVAGFYARHGDDRAAWFTSDAVESSHEVSQIVAKKDVLPGPQGAEALDDLLEVGRKVETRVDEVAEEIFQERWAGKVEALKGEIQEVADAFQESVGALARELGQDPSKPFDRWWKTAGRQVNRELSQEVRDQLHEQAQKMSWNRALLDNRDTWLLWTERLGREHGIEGAADFKRWIYRRGSWDELSKVTGLKGKKLKDEVNRFLSDLGDAYDSALFRTSIEKARPDLADAWEAATKGAQGLTDEMEMLLERLPAGYREAAFKAAKESGEPFDSVKLRWLSDALDDPQISPYYGNAQREALLKVLAEDLGVEMGPQAGARGPRWLIKGKGGRPADRVPVDWKGEQFEWNGWHVPKGKSKLAAQMDEALEHYPTEWLRLWARQQDSVGLTSVKRGYNSGSVIAISKRDSQLLDDAGELMPGGWATALHEAGHSMESAIPGLSEAEWAFVSRRAGEAWDEAGRLGNIPADTMFGGGTELAVAPGRWGHDYSGKTYWQRVLHNRDAAEALGFTSRPRLYNSKQLAVGLQPDAHYELFTTGIEGVLGGDSKYFWRGPGDYDSDYRRFMMGVLAVLSRR